MQDICIRMQGTPEYFCVNYFIFSLRTNVINKINDRISSCSYIRKYKNKTLSFDIRAIQHDYFKVIKFVYLNILNCIKMFTICKL